MTIPTQMSLHGFIATAPELTFTGKGARPVLRPGRDRAHRKEVDGIFTKLDPIFHDLVLYAKTAERAYAEVQARRPDFVASGYINEYEQERPQRPDRDPRAVRRPAHRARLRPDPLRRRPHAGQQPDPPNDELTVVNEPAQAVGL